MNKDAAQIASQAMTLQYQIHTFEALLDEYQGQELTPHRYGRLKLRFKYLRKVMRGLLDDIGAPNSSEGE